MQGRKCLIIKKIDFLAICTADPPPALRPGNPGGNLRLAPGFKANHHIFRRLGSRIGSRV
jgi:hypothetical protein